MQEKIPTSLKIFSLLIIWVLTMLGIHLLFRLQTITFIRNNLAILNCAILIYVPLVATWKLKPPLPLFEKTLGQLFASLKLFIIFSIVIFPIMLGLNHLLQKGVFNFIFFGFVTFSRNFAPTHEWQEFLTAIPYQLFFVALPEEFFFRSYMQTFLNEYFGKPFRFLGAQVGWGLVLTSLLFAISHSFIYVQWWHFSIFFPSLVFGWLREKTGSITASVLFHATSNLFSLWVAMNYR
ncbi:MAG: CPBP family intramembrane metalloprotease [Deltaproteobacteria bacterium]|nr:CPBP family intramembrane metalloprotease [Deltaproteobacteria bacterium]